MGSADDCGRLARGHPSAECPNHGQPLLDPHGHWCADRGRRPLSSDGVEGAIECTVEGSAPAFSAGVVGEQIWSSGPFSTALNGAERLPSTLNCTASLQVSGRDRLVSSLA